MTTQITTPSQGLFEERPALNYPGHRHDAVGQVVGPNWLGERYVAVDRLLEYSAEGEPETRVEFELLTQDRSEFLTSEAKREYITRENSRQMAIEQSPNTEAPSHKDLDLAFKFNRSPWLWS
jgi:hypothetical protein